MAGETRKRLEYAYKFLEPPLSALPAKYHAPISLLVHSLSTGWISEELAELADMEEWGEEAFFIGLTHDIHQKLIDFGLSTTRKSKEYIERKLDELEKSEFTDNVLNALDVDACGKGNPVRGLSKSLSTICHIGDMIQGKAEGFELFYWLKKKLKELDKDLTARFYNIAIPQPFARSYILRRIYENHIRNTDHLALSSPWGLFVITFEEELPEVLEVSWDELRLDEPIEDFENILEAERRRNNKILEIVDASGDELKAGLWSRFARMFYPKDVVDKPINPVFPNDVRGLFVNIDFTDLKFEEVEKEHAFTCGLCGLPHSEEVSLVINMFTKISGTKVTTEKWNRFMPANIKVKAWDSGGQWKNGIGMCPLCALEAVGIRKQGFSGKLNAFITISISKPVPLDLLSTIGRVLRDSDELDDPIVEDGSLDGAVVDYTSATVATSRRVPQPRTDKMFGGRRSVLVRIGKLIEWGLYPVKFLPSLDTSIVDRPLVLPQHFPALDFPVTMEDAKYILPWVGALLEAAGRASRNEGIEALNVEPGHAPLELLVFNKKEYNTVRSKLVEVGVSA